MRRIWITERPWPTDAQTIADAAAVGATEIVHGVPANLAALGITTPGYYELPDPATLPAVKSDAEKLAEARDALAVLDVIEAPVTAADLADVLVDVKTALS